MKKYYEKRDSYEGENSDIRISHEDYESLLDAYNNYLDEDAIDYDSTRTDITVGNNFCSECGQPLDDGSSFCPNCGSPVEDIDPNVNDFYEYDDLFDDYSDDEDYYAGDLYESTDPKAGIEHIGFDDEFPKSTCPKCGKLLDDPNGSYCPYCDCDIEDYEDVDELK